MYIELIERLRKYEVQAIENHDNYIAADLKEAADILSSVQNALDCAWKYGQIDGDHHKLWVIDQMVKELCVTEEAYNDWKEEYEKPVSDEPYDYYTWNTGIAP